MRLYIADPKSALKWAETASGWRKLARAYKASGKAKDNARAMGNALVIERAIRDLANRILRGAA